MKGDYIKREDGIEFVESLVSTMSVCINKDECVGMNSMKKRAIGALHDVPAADVRENVHGRWKTDGCAANGHDDIYCSNCGEDATYFVDSSDGIHWSKIIPNFCPQCGAIMDGGDKR